MTAVLQRLGLLIRLGKPRIALMVGITAFAGAVAAVLHAGEVDMVRILLITFLTITTAYGSAVINNYLDRDIDSLMNRTRGRPLASGQFPPSLALRLGIASVAASVLLIYAVAGALPALLALVAAASYSLLYTLYLKRTTPWASIIGAIPGAMPPLIGYSAIAGGIGVEGLILFAILFIWQPPHFWYLAMMLEGDYRRAGIPVLPVVYGRGFTRRLTLLFSLLLAAALFLPCASSLTGMGYCLGASILSVIWAFVSLFAYAGKVSSRLAFVLSNLVVLLAFLLFTLEVVQSL